MPPKKKRAISVVDISADDDADEECGDTVKEMRIGSNTNVNYKSGLKKIIEYFQHSVKWKHLVILDVHNPDMKFPYTLDIPVPLASLKACFGFYATNPMQKTRKRAKKTKLVVCDGDRNDIGSEKDSDIARESAITLRQNSIQRFANSTDTTIPTTVNDEVSLSSVDDDIVLNDKDDGFQHLKNIDKATISFSGLSGYHRYVYIHCIQHSISVIIICHQCE